MYVCVYMSLAYVLADRMDKTKATFGIQPRHNLGNLSCCDNRAVLFRNNCCVLLFYANVSY